MSVVSLLAGAGIFLAGMIAGRIWPSRRRKAKPVKPICGCTHHISMHDPKTRACNAAVKEHHGYDIQDNPIYEFRACACRQYIGPEPLPEYYVPEITNA